MVRRPAFFLLLALAALLFPGPAGAIRHPNDFWFGDPPDDRWYFGGDEDFLVVTILAAHDSATTNARPPELTVRVEEVLRGRLVRGVRRIGWPAIPLFLPCAVGEGATIRRWNETPLRGPAPGRRLIVGGHMTAEGLWISDGMMRWDDDGSAEAADVRRKVREWTASAAARQRREAQERARRADAERSDRERLERVRETAERSWLRRERSLAAEIDIAELVRASDAVFIADRPGRAWPEGPWTRTLKNAAWLLETRVSGPGSKVVTFGREALRDSAVTRWLAAPADDAPGKQAGDSLRLVAFVRRSFEPTGLGSPGPFFRAVDPVRGFLLADSTVLRAVRRAVAARGGETSERATSCGASFAEFAVTDTSEAARIAFKLTAIDPRIGSVVLASGPPGGYSGFTSLHAGVFPPCAGPGRLAADEHETALQFLVRPARMSALLDSLATLPRVVDGTFDPADRLTLTLLRDDDGRPRSFEATLDSVSTVAVCRFLVHLFPEPGVLHWNLPRFWGSVHRDLQAMWWEPAPLRPRTDPIPSPGIASDHAAILGFLVDRETREPLRGYIVRIARPGRIVETGSAGDFVFTRLPPGTRGMLVYGPGHEPSYAEVELARGELQPVLIRIEREGTRKSGFQVRTRVAPPFEPPPLDTHVSFDVRDEQGRAVADAYVRLEYGDVQAAGFTDATGQRTFRHVPLGPARILVQAPGHASHDARIDLRSYAPERREVVLAKADDRLGLGVARP